MLILPKICSGLSGQPISLNFSTMKRSVKNMVDEKELQWHSIRSSGAGGQHVNKVATAVQLRFDIAQSRSLPETVRQRLLQSSDQRINNRGEIVIDARRFRSQLRNRQDALARLLEFINVASVPTVPRKKIRRPKKWNENRLKQKQLRSKTKQLRRTNHTLD